LTAPLLVLAWGNPSRGDDALGPRFAEQVERWGLDGVECLVDFQLQVEHALDLEGRRRVLFVDAARAHDWDEAECFRVRRVQASRQISCRSHAMHPEEVLRVWSILKDAAPPACWLLALRGQRFELGEEVSELAQQCLGQALAWAQSFLCARSNDCLDA